MEEIQVKRDNSGRTTNRLLHDIIDDISLSLGMVKLSLRRDSMEESLRGDLTIVRDSLQRACESVQELSTIVRE